MYYLYTIKKSTGILSGMELPELDEFDITKQVFITPHSTGPAAINQKNTNISQKAMDLTTLKIVKTLITNWR